MVDIDLEIKSMNVSIGSKQIIKDISIKAEAGKITAILGPNGSGKSTILKSIYTHSKMHKGDVYLGGKNLKDFSPKKLAQIMAVVGQFNAMSFDFSVREIVMMGRTPHLGFLQQESKTDISVVEDALQKVDMLDFIDRKYQSLSGGEKQRVIMARAIAQEPKVLILDEPTNHLDIKQQLQVLAVAKSLNVTVLAALHDLTLASQFCDCIYFLKNGSLKLYGNPRDVIKKENIQEIFDVESEIYYVENNQKLLIDYIK